MIQPLQPILLHVLYVLITFILVEYLLMISSNTETASSVHSVCMNDPSLYGRTLAKAHILHWGGTESKLGGRQRKLHVVCNETIKFKISNLTGSYRSDLKKVSSECDITPILTKWRWVHNTTQSRRNIDARIEVKSTLTLNVDNPPSPTEVTLHHIVHLP